MRKKFIAGNWKMHLDKAGAVALAQEVVEQAKGINGVTLAVCPPSVLLHAVGEVVSGTNVGLGAQNMYHEPKGAFTGEVSPAMLGDAKCQYVILGHSERRHTFQETSEAVNQKVKAALAADLIPIVCVGETLAERKADQTIPVIRRQCDHSLLGLSAEQMCGVVIAYEPVWAIGTGEVATVEQAVEVHVAIREILKARYNAGVAETVLIQYGGSVKPSNAAELLACNDIDGALVGGASLTADSFLGIADKAPT